VLTIDFDRIHIQPGDRILDIGCGEGRHTIEACRQKDTLCVGADFIFDNLMKTRKKLEFHKAINDLSCKRIDLSCMDVTALPFKNNSLDLVICSEVLEHIPDDARAISELVRILKPGKILAVSVPRFWPERICWILSPEYSRIPMGHVRIYKKTALIRTIEAFGVDFLFSHYAHSLHAPFWWLKCLKGLERTDSTAVNQYHRLLVWDLMKKPAATRFIDRLFNPILGKSLVLYFKKSYNLISFLIQTLSNRRHDMTKIGLFFFLFSILIVLQSCAVTTAPVKRRDPLIGAIIDTRTSEPVEFDTLIQNISTQDVIYLSEKHDNPDHHAMQQRVIKSLIEKGLTPLIGFEFFSMEDTPDILNFLNSAKVHHSKEMTKIIEADLRKKLGWDTQPDPMWAYYYDLLTLARDKGLEAAGLDLPETLKKRITRKGMSGITPLEKEQIFSTPRPGQSYKDYMFSIFKDVHCSMGNEQMQTKLYDTWLARNDKMALSITRLKQYHQGPLVIIIGGGHTEYGLGVMDRVAALAPHLRQINFAFREIGTAPAGLAEYLVPLDLEGYPKAPPADFLFFTQLVSYEDPCEEFRKTMLKMKKPGDR